MNHARLLDKRGKIGHNQGEMGNRILLIEDEEKWLSEASTTLTAAGYEVLMATDSENAIPFADTEGVGLVILDTKLAVEDSLQLMRFIKHNHPDLPILLYPEPGEDDTRVNSLLAAGADQFVPKGSVEELLVTVGYYFRS